MENTLYWGDNLDVLRGKDGQNRPYFPDECVDLIYLDPPFNSNRPYNLLFKDQYGVPVPSLIRAFDDTWTWTEETDRLFSATISDTSGAYRKARKVLASFRELFGTSEMMAYLAMMTPRLIELHRVLKPAGSLFLHCDPTAGSYLRVILDSVFGPANFRNEITWKRSHAHNDTKQGMQRCGRIHDTILFYGKTDRAKWSPIYTAYTSEYLESEYRHKTDTDRHYKESDLTAAKDGGDTSYEWRVKRERAKKVRWVADLDNEYLDPNPMWEYKAVTPYNRRYWAYSKQNLVEFALSDQLIHRSTGMPRLMQFADEMPGVSLQDLWTDIALTDDDERIGYPTQKPLALLQRLIEVSTDPGDVVLDPFCGCGTAVDAAQELGRRWIGIDVTHLAVEVIKDRLRGRYGALPGKGYRLVGEPTDLGGAAKLAEVNPDQFEIWALRQIGALPWEGKQKAGGDDGRDGILVWRDSEERMPREAVVSVKSGQNIGPKDIRDLIGAVSNAGTELGIFISLKEPTAKMKATASAAGRYLPKYVENPALSVPRIQIITVADLLEKKTGVHLPQGSKVTSQKLPAAVAKPKPKQEQMTLLTDVSSAEGKRSAKAKTKVKAERTA